MPKYYPIMLDVRDRLAIVIGGDQVAAEKAAALRPLAWAPALADETSGIRPAPCLAATSRSIALR